MKKEKKTPRRKRSILWMVAVCLVTIALTFKLHHELVKSVSEATTEATIELAFARMIGMEE